MEQSYCPKSNAQLAYQFMYLMSDSSLVFSQLLKSSKGRDKVCALTQYTLEFYHDCHKYSDILEIQNLFKANSLKGVKVAKVFKDQLSQGRKIFRLFKFIGQVRRIQKILKSKKQPLVKLLLVSSHVFSFFYYLLDNSLLCIKILDQINITDPKTYGRFRRMKNNMTLFKNIINFVKNLLFVCLRINKQKQLIEIIEQSDDVTIDFHDERYDVMMAIIRQKTKMRSEIIDLCLSVIRMIILIKKLKYFSLEKYTHPLFFSICGMANCLASFLIQLMKNRKQVFKKNDEIVLDRPVNRKYDIFSKNNSQEQITTNQNQLADCSSQSNIRINSNQNKGFNDCSQQKRKYAKIKFNLKDRSFLSRFFLKTHFLYLNRIYNNYDIQSIL